MDRGKVAAMKDIENTTTGEQASFSKLRSNFVKKAPKLSVLCDAEVGLIGFSSSGSVFDLYAGSRSMQEITQDYHHIQGKTPSPHPVCAYFSNSQHEEKKRLKDESQMLKMEEREDMEEMKLLQYVKELEKLESKLECQLNCVRQMKELLIAEQREELGRKEQELLSENERLNKQMVWDLA